MIATLVLTAAIVTSTIPMDGEAPLPQPIQIGAKDHDGPSLYQGRHYSPRHEKVRRCIRHRESDNDYRAVSRTGRYRGAYQMSPELGIGASWMIQRDLRRAGYGENAKRTGALLRSHPINQWHPYYQDKAFWLVWDHGKGRAHWAATVPGTGCF